MWNGAVFMPLIEEMDTIEPGLALRTQLGGDGLAGEERRLQVGGEQVAPVRPRHPGRRHPRRRRRAARDVDQSVQLAVGAPDLIHHGGDAVVGRRVGRHRHDRQTALGERDHVLVEVLLGPAHRDHGGARLGGHRGHRRADAAATCAGYHHDAAVEAEETLRRRHDSLSCRSNCPDNIWCSANWRTLFRSTNALVKHSIVTSAVLLSGLDGLARVRSVTGGQTTRYPAPSHAGGRGRLASRTPHRGRAGCSAPTVFAPAPTAASTSRR